MDQDFHYYGTYYAARVGGFDQAAAGRIAKASNFIDFMHEGAYGGRWRLVNDTTRRSRKSDYDEVGVLDNPRYTFQSGKLSTGVAPEDGLWCSFHFTPGNYAGIEAPSTEQVHGRPVADLLPTFRRRTVRPDIDEHAHRLLNRPQSALSRALLADTLSCVKNDDRLRHILSHALAGDRLLDVEPDETLARFRQLLLGARAHVIADTWAHQDWSGIHNSINTYWDVIDNPGRQSIEYKDVGSSWKRVVLSCLKHENLQAVPNGTSYLGHGWMGHLPDYSFIKYRYKPRWRERAQHAIVRDNPTEYRHAFLELCSLFSQANGSRFRPGLNKTELALAAEAIDEPCEIANKEVCPRRESSLAWLRIFDPTYGRPADHDLIDAQLEPDQSAVLDGMVDTPSFPASKTRYGTYTVSVDSDLYLFQIVADYHFHFVRHWLRRHEIMDFTGSWSQKDGPLTPSVVELFE